MRSLLNAVAVPIVALSVLAPPAARAQSAAPAKPGCVAAPATPATPASTGPADGTAPGNMGSTGFSGAGLGGAFTGTTPNGPVATSPSAQPATAKGLDPIAAAPKAADAGKC